MVSVDRRAMEQVIMNLLEWASKQPGDDNSIDVSVSYDAECVTIGIANRECQLPPGEKKQSKGELAGRLDSKTTAGGLGLTLACMLVESHGGMIWVEDGDTGGAATRVRLARAHESTATDTPQSRAFVNAIVLD
jgi:two-component system sensor histidine kinase KdpD